MIKRIAGLLLAALTLTACANKSQTFEIDNPTDAPLTVRIDGNELPIPAHAARPIKLKPGEHLLQSERLGDVRFIVYTRGKGGLINPTLSEYVLVREVYVTDEDKMKNFGSGQSKIDLGDVTFQGPYDKVHDLFIPHSWDFGVREPFPEEQTVAHVNELGGRISTKIFTAPDFITYVETATGEPGAYRAQQPKGYVAPTYTVERAPAALPPLDPVLEAHAGPLRAIYARYLTTTDADAQRALQKEDFEASMAFTKATMLLHKDASEEARASYTAFSDARVRVMGRGVIVLP